MNIPLGNGEISMWNNYRRRKLYTKLDYEKACERGTKQFRKKRIRSTSARKGWIAQYYKAQTIDKQSKRYWKWRKKVLERDHFTCQGCWKHGPDIKLYADYRKHWIDYPDLRFDVDNGETLCEFCLCKKYPFLAHKKYKQLKKEVIEKWPLEKKQFEKGPSEE